MVWRVRRHHVVVVLFLPLHPAVRHPPAIVYELRSIGEHCCDDALQAHQVIMRLRRALEIKPYSAAYKKNHICQDRVCQYVCSHVEPMLAIRNAIKFQVPVPKKLRENLDD